MTGRYVYERPGHWIIRRSHAFGTPKHLRNYVIDRYHWHTDLLFHFGSKRTAAAIQGTFFWATLQRDVSQRLKKCRTCAEWMPNLHPEVVSTPHSPPMYPFQRLQMDYATGLPPVTWQGRTYTGFVTFIDAYSKYVWAFPTDGDNQLAEELVDDFIRYIYQVDGLPDQFVSDNGKQFISSYFQTIAIRLGLGQKYSLAAQPRSHGQAERAVSLIQQSILTLAPTRNWVALLPMMTVAINQAKHSVTGFTPHYVLRGRPFRHQFQSAPIGANPQANMFIDQWKANLTLVTHALRKAQHKMGNRHVLDVPRNLPNGTEVYIHKDAYTNLNPYKTVRRFHGPFIVTGQSENSITVSDPIYIRNDQGEVVPTNTVNRQHIKVFASARADTHGTDRDFSPSGLVIETAEQSHAEPALADSPSTTTVTDLYANRWKWPQAFAPFKPSYRKWPMNTLAYGFVTRFPGGIKMALATTEACDTDNTILVTRHAIHTHGTDALRDALAKWKQNVKYKRFSEPTYKGLVRPRRTNLHQTLGIQANPRAGKIPQASS